MRCEAKDSQAGVSARHSFAVASGCVKSKLAQRFEHRL